MTAVFRDPIHDGAADPVLARRTGDPTYWMLYTNRRADAPEGQGVAWVHGTDLGLASSTDGGATWLYRGVVEGLDHEPGRNTFWAPEVVWAEGCFHLYVSYVTGVPERWEGHPRSLHHYTSDDILHWRHHGPVVPSLTQIIDACVHPLPYGGYRLWFKNEADEASTWACDSDDLFRWGPPRHVLSTDGGHEGPNVFRFRGHYWMVIDSWDGQLAFRSDDLDNWTPAGRILAASTARPGTDDEGPGYHADVVTDEDRAYILYFTHPPGDRDVFERRRSTIHVATLDAADGELICRRDAETRLRLSLS
jgi:hypothetical protein